MTKKRKTPKSLIRLPTSAKAQQTKQDILTATAHIVLKEGLDAVNTNRIAEKAGVSIGSVYQYYTKKEEIFADLLQGIILERERRLKSALGLRTLTDSTEEIISRVVDALFDFESNQDPRLEAALLPLMFRANNEKSLIKMAEELESGINPLLKMLLLAKNPKLIKRDLNTVVFVLIQSMRGIWLGLSLPHSKQTSSKSLKAELRHLLHSYLIT